MKVTLTGFINGVAIMSKGYPRGETPSTYKKLGICGHGMGNRYNPSTLTIWQARDKTLRYEIYRDGCFYPYFGKIELI